MRKFFDTPDRLSCLVRARLAFSGALFLAVTSTVPWGVGIASAQQPYTPTSNLAAGARLFQTKRCIQCHAINDVGGKEGPDLGRIEPPGSFYGLAAAMWNHLPQMAQRIQASRAERPYFTPDEMSDLIAFLYPSKSFDGGPGDAKRGRQLVSDKGCLACHELSGPGRRDVRSLDELKGFDSPWTVIAAMWNHAFLMELKTEEQRGAWPRFSAAEMADLVAFLRAHAYSRDRDR
jgi:mono/diheme cytochrome c family protein